MSQDGASSPASPTSQLSQDSSIPPQDSEYTSPLTKEAQDKSLESLYSKITTLTQEIAALGARTDHLKTQHDELSRMGTND